MTLRIASTLVLCLIVLAPAIPSQEVEVYVGERSDYTGCGVILELGFAIGMASAFAKDRRGQVASTNVNVAIGLAGEAGFITGSLETADFRLRQGQWNAAYIELQRARQLYREHLETHWCR